MKVLSKKKLPLLLIGMLALSSPMMNAQADCLKQVVSSTVNTNPDVFVKLKGWLAAKEGIKKAEGGYMPSIDASANWGSQRLNDLNTNFGYDSLHPIGVDFTLTQMLFDGFATKSEVDRNVNRAVAENYQVQGTSDDVALLAIKSYLDVLRTQQIVKYAQENYIAHTQTYGAIKKLAKQGAGREAEATQASGRVALAQANLLAAENNYNNAKATYFRVVGKAPNNLQLPTEPTGSALPNSEQQAIKYAIENHPLLKSAKADVEEARAQYNVSKAAFYPRLDAVLSTSNGHDINSNIGATESYEALLRVKYNLFRGGSDMAYKRQTSELLGEAQQIRNRTYDQVVENARLAWNFLKTNEEQMKYYKEHRNAAMTTETAYLKQFTVGKRALLDILDSQDELFNAKTDYTNATMNIIYSKYRLLNAQGKVLTYLQIPVPSYCPNKKKDLEFLHIQPNSTRYIKNKNLIENDDD